MNEQVKWGLMFAVEGDVAACLEKLQKFQSPEFLADCKNLVAACDWLLKQDLPYYINMGFLRRDLELLRGKL